MTTIRIIANIARSLSLITALVAAIVVCIWIWAPHWIDQVDQYALKSYREHYEKKYYEAVENLQNDPVEAIPQMEAFAHSLKLVRKGDRLSQMKKVIFSQLTRTCLQQRNFSKALFWAQQWVLFDDRDFDAMLSEVDVLLSTPNQKALGQDKLRKLAQDYHDVSKIRSRAISAGISISPGRSQ